LSNEAALYTYDPLWISTEQPIHHNTITAANTQFVFTSCAGRQWAKLTTL